MIKYIHESVKILRNILTSDYQLFLFFIINSFFFFFELLSIFERRHETLFYTRWKKRRSIKIDDGITFFDRASFYLRELTRKTLRKHISWRSGYRYDIITATSIWYKLVEANADRPVSKNKWPGGT